MPELNIVSWSDGDSLKPTSLNNIHAQIEAIVNALDTDNLSANAAIKLTQIATSLSSRRMFELTSDKSSLLCDFLQSAEIYKVSDTDVGLIDPKPAGTSFRAQMPALIAEDGRIGVATSQPADKTISGVTGIKYIYANVNSAGVIALDFDTAAPSAVAAYKYFLGICYWDNTASKIRAVFSRYKQRPVAEYMPGFIKGCGLTWTDADKVTLGSGSIRLDNSFSGTANPVDIEVPSGMVCNFTTSGVGGLDAGETRTKSKWYYIYLVFGISGIDVIASDSPSVLPTDLSATYDWYRLVGSVFLNGDIAKSICGFIQTGNYNEREYHYQPFASDFDVAGSIEIVSATITGVGTTFHSGLVGCSIHSLEESWAVYPLRPDYVGRIISYASTTSIDATNVEENDIPAAAAGTDYKLDYQMYPPYKQVDDYDSGWITMTGASGCSDKRIPASAIHAFVSGYINDQMGNEDDVVRLFIRPTGSGDSRGTNITSSGDRGKNFSLKVPLLSSNSIDFRVMSNNGTIAIDYHEGAVAIWITGYVEEL